MSRPKQTVLEYRNYELPADFPLITLTGDGWHISPVPSKRLHFHNCLEIGLCHTESGVMILEDRRAPFRSGFVTCIARNVPHTTWSDPGKYSLWSYLYLDADALLGSFGRTQIPDPQAFNRMLSGCRFMLSPEEYPWALPLVQAILDEKDRQAMGYQSCIRSLLLTLMILLLRVDAKENGSAELDRNLFLISPALDYIQEHYMQSFPLETLAEACHISPTHFRRLFHAQMGTNPLSFLHQVRILKSCAHLRTTEESVAEIAAQAGYTSLSCFNRHFQRIMGCTPSAWRRSGGDRPTLLTYSGWTQAEIPEDTAGPDPNQDQQ